MAIPQNDLLLLLVGSIASLTSFLITILYSIRRKWQPRRSKVRPENQSVEICIIIDGKTINAGVSLKDLKKISNILKKRQTDDIQLLEGSYRH